MNVTSSIISNSTDRFWSIDVNLNITIINDVMLKEVFASFGEELSIGSNVLKGLPENLHTIFSNRYKRALAGEQFFELDSIDQNGVVVTIKTTYNPIVFNEEIVGVACYAIDVSNIKAIEDNLKKSEANLNALIENNTSGIWSIDVDYKLIASNSNFIESFNKIYSSSIQPGSVLIDFVPDYEKLYIKEQYDRALKGEVFTLTRKYNIGEQFPLYLEISYKPIVVEGGAIIGVSCFANDITQFKKVQIELENSKANLRSLIENNNTSIWSVDRDYRLIATNSRYKTNFDINFSCSLEPGSVLIDLLPEPHKTKVKGWIDRALAGEHFSNIEQTNLGEVLFVDASFSPIKVNDEVVGVACFSRDITELKAYEHKLIEANASKDRLFSILAHDLKGPLRNIKSLTQLLKKGVSCTDDEREEIVSLIETSSHSTYNLLDNLLTWSLSQTNGIVVKPIKLNMLDLVNKTLMPLEQMAHDKGVSLIKEIDLDIWAFADYDMISLVLRNLVSNGLKFTNKGGYVKVAASVSNVDNQVLISVSDNGIGMDKEIMDTLFEIGGKHSRLGTANEKGTGFGMVIIKDFVEKNNGTLLVESEVNKGSTFSFKIRSVTTFGKYYLKK